MYDKSNTLHEDQVRGTQTNQKLMCDQKFRGTFNFSLKFDTAMKWEV